MKVLPLVTPLIVLMVACATGEQAKMYGRPPEPVLSYSIDTVYRTYNTDLSGNMSGGADLHVFDSAFFEVRNYCGPGELVVLDHHSDRFRKLLTFPGDCRHFFTKVTNDHVYMLNRDGVLFRYTAASRQGEPIANFKADSSLYRLGLDVEQYKPGSNLFVNVPENVFYFRVMQSFDTDEGIYGYGKMRSGSPLFCKYDLVTKKMQFFGSDPAANRKYGLLEGISDLFIGDSIVTSEAVSGKITVIDTRSGAVTTAEARSRYDTVPIRELKMPRKFENRKNAKWEHGVYSARYDPLHYNPYTRCYYRIFHPALPREKGNGLLNTEYDKQCVLMVLDEKLRLVDEKLLPLQRLYGFSIFPEKSGVQLYLPELYDFTKTRSTYAYLRITHSPVK